MNAPIHENPLRILAMRPLRPSDFTDCPDDGGAELCIRSFLCPVEAGWPSPAEGYEEPPVNLNRLLVKNPPATFIVTVAGNSMTGIGIHDGDRLLVDKSIPAAPGKVVIASVGGEFTVKSYERRGKRFFLKPHAEGYPEIEITERDDALVWGVVTYVLHAL